MSVYTTIYKHDLDQLLKHYTVGTVVDFSGVEDGIENTTYFITTEKEKECLEWVLTLFETAEEAQLRQYVHLLAFLAQRGLPIPNPICDAKGQSIQTVHKKPAILFPKLDGSHLTTPLCSHCNQTGALLAKLHTETISYPQPLPPPRSIDWINAESKAWLSKMVDEEQRLFRSALKLCHYKLPEFEAMPKAVIHGDLFIDNTLFQGGQLTGVIDFYSAGYDYMLMDIAVVMNDWCVDSQGKLDVKKVQALMDGYNTLRPITALEHTALPMFLLLAALRFWTYRLKVQFQNQAANRSGDLIKVKDPNWFRDIVALRQRVILN